MQLLAYVLLTETFFLTKKLKAPIARERGTLIVAGKLPSHIA